VPFIAVFRVVSFFSHEREPALDPLDPGDGDVPALPEPLGRHVLEYGWLHGPLLADGLGGPVHFSYARKEGDPAGFRR